MKRMENNEIEYKINRNLIIGWLIIVVVLLTAYFGEFLKGQRTGRYMIVFSLVTALPAFVCAFLFWKDKESRNLRYFIIGGYFLMYTFVLLTGSTPLVFTYILPLLSLIVLYHQPRLVILLGIGSLVTNLIFILRMAVGKQITVENSKEIEIQIALLFLCFGFLLVASKLYESMRCKNELYLQELDEKQSQLQRVTLQTITTIANIIDAKDEYTKGHSQRVAEYSAAIAKELGRDEAYVNNVRYIGLLHDIGKIGIPDSILNKPGRLTEEEYELMKRHVEIGGNILKDNRMIDDLSDGVRYHHERYDGRGYMQHLRGEQIPEIARIIGLADAYDAMTSNRVYRTRLTDEQVLAELERCSGMQFDPKITAVFIQMLREGKIKQLSPDMPGQQEKPEIEGSGAESTLEQSTRLLQDMIRRQNEKELQNEERDYLTGVYTKKLGERRIAARLAENGGGLLLIELINVREVNDTYGVVCGDHLIRTVAEMLDGFRPGMMVTRFSGDEFMCLVDGVTDREDMEWLMAQMHEKITRRIRESNTYEKVDLCVGGAISPAAGKEYMTLFSAADKALYYVKQMHRGGWYLYEVAEHRAEASYRGTKSDLKQLMENLEDGALSQNPQHESFPELAPIHNFVKSIDEGQHEKTRLILMSLRPIDEKATTVEERDEAMGYLEKAIHEALRKTDIMMRFSSTQCVIFLVGMEKEQLSFVTNRIMNNFYRTYDKKTMVLSYEVAKLGEKQ